MELGEGKDNGYFLVLTHREARTSSVLPSALRVQGANASNKKPVAPGKQRETTNSRLVPLPLITQGRSTATHSWPILTLYIAGST